MLAAFTINYHVHPPGQIKIGVALPTSEGMRFSKIVFVVASAWGVLVLTPLYLMFDEIGRQDPPLVTHPEFYYGFAGAALAWQFAYFLIGRNPARFRPMMLVGVFAKMSYFVPVTLLYLHGRMSARMFTWSAPDSLFAVLFLAAYFKTRPGVTVPP